MNFYNISQLPERFQTAKHFHSSLQEPTLDNVQAQLFVARQRNYELAQKYFQNKYGNSQIYDSYVQTNQLQGLGPPKEQVYDFKAELDKKALEIRQQQLNKINQRKAARGNSQRADNYNSGDYTVVNKRKSQTKNIWQKEEKYVEQIQEDYEQAPQPYNINIEQEKQTGFISDFKNYLNNKKKLKVTQNSKLQGDKSILKQSELATSKKEISKKEEKCYQQELVKKIFREVIGKTDKNAKVQKIQFIQYLNSNPKILKVLGTTPEYVTTSVMSQSCKEMNFFSPSDGLIWIYGCLGKIEQVKRLKAEHEFQAVPSGCMLSKDLMQLFQNVFRMMDRHNDLIIKRVPFIGRLTSEPAVKKSLNLPAVFEPEYNRYVSLRRIFQRIEIQTLLCSQQEKRLNEYISWNQFIGYFQSGHQQKRKYDLIVLVQSLKNQQKFGFSDMPESVSQIVAQSFKKLDKGQEIFNTLQIINQIKFHKDYEIQKYTFIKKGVQENNASQTFEEALLRIKETGLKYVSPKEFLQYFSARGKPIQQYQVQKQGEQAKQLSPSKVSFVQNELFPQQQEQPDGYDSDPEVYNNSKFRQSAKEFRRSQKQFKQFQLTSKSFMQPDNNQDQNSNNNSLLKVTIPQPFSFEQREKERQLARSRQKSLQPIPQSTEFKAKPIPSKVAEVGLLQKMNAEQQRKNEQRKRSSMIMTLANQRPFSFDNRKVTRKTKQERQQFIFKAKPIPWYCSVDLLARKKQEQIIRNQRIAKAAQESLAKAKLPPRMEKDHLEKQVKKVGVSTNKPRQSQSLLKAKEPPNFQKIHKDFEQALERKRKQNKTTQIKQFNFATNAKDNSSKIRQQNSQIQQFKPQKHAYVPPNNSNIDIFAQSTAKFIQQVQKRRKQAQEKRKKQTQLKQKEEQRRKVDEQLKKKVQEAAHRDKENKQKEAQAKRKEQNAKQLATFKGWKNQRIEKARQQPLLVDRVSKRDQKIQKMKKLWQVSQTLKKNGIKGKQHDHYFKREELLLISDYQHLKDKI